MNKLTLSLVSALLFWGSVSIANIPSTADAVNKECEEATAFAKHLNRSYSDLDVKIDLTNKSDAHEVLGELSALEDVLHGKYKLPGGSLVMVDCNRCVCVGCKSKL